MRQLIEYCSQTNKPCYDKITAITAINKRYKDAHQSLKTYQCEDCNMWHLTSNAVEKKKYKHGRISKEDYDEI